MLKQTLYQQCSEQIHSCAYADSLHLRFIVLYTAFNRMIVIAEDKYSLKKHTTSFDYQETIVAMKYSTFKLHILTIKGAYQQIVLGEVFNDGYRLPSDQIQIKNDTFSDFLFAHKRIIFISQQGTIYFYDPQKQIVITQIALKMQLLQYQIVRHQKEQFVAVTEFNDLLRLSEDEPEPQVSRFSDAQFTIKQMWLSEQNLLILQEGQQNRIVKYKLHKLTQFKKVYYLYESDYKFEQLIELPKLFVCLVFDRNRFKVITLSKRLMKESSNSIIMSCIEFTNNIVHISDFSQSFGQKVTKAQVSKQQQVLDQNYTTNQSLLFSSTSIRLLILENSESFNLEFKQNYKENFIELQQWQNYCYTFRPIPIIRKTWQDNVIYLLWAKTSGFNYYLKNKAEVDSQIVNWVNTLNNSCSVDKEFIDWIKISNTPYIVDIEDKILATKALLEFTNLSNEIIIPAIVSLIFNKYESIGTLVSRTSQNFINLLQQLKVKQQPIYEYWKGYQPLFFILIVALEHQLDKYLDEEGIFCKGSFLDKIHLLILKSKVKQRKVKLILLTKQKEHLQEYLMNQVFDEVEFGIKCNLLTMKSSLNIFSIQEFLENCDKIYVNKLFEIFKLNDREESLEEQLKSKYPCQYGIVMMKMMKEIPSNDPYYDIVQWFYS